MLLDGGVLSLMELIESLKKVIIGHDDGLVLTYFLVQYLLCTFLGPVYTAEQRTQHMHLHAVSGLPKSNIDSVCTYKRELLSPTKACSANNRWQPPC